MPKISACVFSHVPKLSIPFILILRVKIIYRFWLFFYVQPLNWHEIYHAQKCQNAPNVGIQTIDQAFAACIPVYEGFGLFTRRSYFAACEQYRRRSVCAFAQSHQRPNCSLFRKHMGLFEIKPAFGAHDKARPKQVPPATETTQNIKTSLVEI